MDSGWGLWLWKTTTAGFAFCCSLSSLLSFLALATLWLLQGPHRYLWVCDPSSIRTLRIFQRNLTDFEPQFSIFNFFHVTVSFGGLSNPLTLVFTPSQHQQGVPMIWGRHHFTGLYYSVHILFILHKPFSQASSSIYFSLFWTISLLLALLSLKCPEKKLSNIGWIRPYLLCLP